MNIYCEVLSVETIGDACKLRLQGGAGTDACWRPLLSLSVEVPDTERNRRAYYVGRSVTVTITPGAK